MSASDPKLPRKIMVVAGETSGDWLAAQLIRALKARLPQDLEIIGAAGPATKAEGASLQIDLTEHAVVGLWEVIKEYRSFKLIFDKLVRLAIKERPDLVLLVDYSGFNRRFATALRQKAKWDLKIVFYVSPQVWASRPKRAQEMAAAGDLLLVLFEFEKKWYKERIPRFKVEFVGHPMIEEPLPQRQPAAGKPIVLLLPGSRRGELARHVPVMIEAVRLIQAKQECEVRMVLPNENLLDQAKTLSGFYATTVCGNLPEELARASIAIASTGTVTLQCALAGVPTIALYKTSLLTYEVGKRIVQVHHLAMPNILAGRTIIPEFIQHAATGKNIAAEALDLLNNAPRQDVMKKGFAEVAQKMGKPGASERAADAILGLYDARS